MSILSFPNESEAYRKARSALLDEETRLRAEIAGVAAMRAALPAGGAVKEDYEFKEIDGNGAIAGIRMSELFENDKNCLFLYGFMYGPENEDACPMCSSFLDALNGNAPHLGHRINVAVVAKSPIHRISDYARMRGWDRLRMLSSQHNSYGVDYFAENEKGDQMPMANVFVQRSGVIQHFWGSELLYADVDGQPRHVDSMWPLWNVFDTTPEGRGTDWYPSLKR
jgi:predicted dithiol-disulfide oxidoreductase (DUF899 family)